MIIVPTYNEKNNIQNLVGRIRRVLPEELLLFIDDNSPDGTAGQIRALMADDVKIKLISRPKKSGFGSAYIEGLVYALQTDSEFVITMDADLSHDPEVL